MNWQDRTRAWIPPTLNETVAAMQENINAAAIDERNARADVQRYNPGDERLKRAQLDVVRYAADQRHWRAQLAYWRGLLDRFPQLADVPAAEAVKADYARPVRRVAKVIPMPTHWAEREPGGDDLEEAPF
jgi:hypothetical protein